MPDRVDNPILKMGSYRLRDSNTTMDGEYTTVKISVLEAFQLAFLGRLPACFFALDCIARHDGKRWIRRIIRGEQRAVIGCP